MCVSIYTHIYINIYMQTKNDSVSAIILHRKIICKFNEKSNK